MEFLAAAWCAGKQLKLDRTLRELVIFCDYYIIIIRLTVTGQLPPVRVRVCVSVRVRFSVGDNRPRTTSTSSLYYLFLTKSTFTSEVATNN